MLIARVKLRRILGHHGAASDLARRCKVTPNAVWLWKSGKTRPSLPMREQIERATDGMVRAVDWITASELRASHARNAAHASPAKQGRVR